MKIKVYNTEGNVVGERELSPAIFEVVPKEALIHQVVVAMEANMRSNIAHTKTRGEVRGGGRKPWKQKGTGRARHGSTRSPIWIGGGVTFGPRNERNFKQKINKKMRQKAYFMCLSDRAASGNLVVLDKLNFDELKTKKLAEILKKLPIGKKTLVALAGKNEKIKKSAANLSWLHVDLVSNLNALEIMRHKYLLIPEDAINKIEEMYKKI